MGSNCKIAEGDFLCIGKYRECDYHSINAMSRCQYVEKGCWYWYCTNPDAIKEAEKEESADE